MLIITEKPDLMNTIVAKVWTQAGISSSLEPANLVFCINLRENGVAKREILIEFKLNLVKTLASKG